MADLRDAVLCQNCDKQNAIKWCENCPDSSSYYCEKCFDSHIMLKIFANHRGKLIAKATPHYSFETFLDNLGELETYKTKKFTTCDALLIRESNHDDYTFNPKGLLILILQKVMACNPHCRKILLAVEPATKPYRIVYHPMDTLLALIHCCNSFLQQDIFTRLHACQFALPFLLPIPDSKKILLPIWAMRNIVNKWSCVAESNANSAYSANSRQRTDFEGRLVADCNAPIISFMRISKATNLFKSKIINGVLNSDSTWDHHYFFDGDCKGSNADRKFIDGLAEICWYLPDESHMQADSFQIPLIFCNLRGNALNHLIQFEILLKNSRICFIFLKGSDIDEQFISMLSKKFQSCSICLLLWPMNKTERCYAEEQIQKISNCCLMIFEDQDNGLATSADKIKCKIFEHLQPNAKFLSLSQTIQQNIAWQFPDTIEVDENDKACQSGRKLANEVMEYVTEARQAAQHKPSGKIKQALVPLQGTLWQEWANLEKRAYRNKIESLEKEKQETFAKLLNTGISKVMQKFIEIVSSKSEHQTVTYFLQWLKLSLDDHSRKELPELQQKRDEIRSQLSKFDHENSALSGIDKQKQLQLQKQLYQYSLNLNDASFGLEHFFRELGLIYEIFFNSGIYTYQTVLPANLTTIELLPKLAAKLLYDGYPLELLDGDAAHIAITWVLAVLKELKDLINGKSQLIVISALGLQSSGKSTLLNVTFGLRFAVGAGRCTRGAYMQLLRCHDSFKCSYALIIDTEGLRAPELQYKGSTSHDNELAALAIGLADVTIVNVFGEVSSEMNDILQTTVHAFLRMMEAKLKPSCCLVQHHVDKMNSSKIKEGLHALQEKLDEVTLYAAKEQHCLGVYKKFNDVIKFNIKKDVLQFPNLFAGNPPMSPVNPQYCEETQKMKMLVMQSVLDFSVPDDDAEDMEKQKQDGATSIACCSLAEFNYRVEKLWSAILRENFIFDFENAIQIKAYTELDMQSGQWSWDLKNLVAQWEIKTRRMLRARQLLSEEEIQQHKDEISQELREKHEQIQKEMKKFFEKQEFARVLVKWQSATEIDFKALVAQQVKHSVIFVDENVKKEKMREAVNNIQNYQKRINDAVKDLVQTMHITKDTKISDDTIDSWKELFSNKWNEWIEEIEQNTPFDCRDIANLVRDQLYQVHGVSMLQQNIDMLLEHKCLKDRAKGPCWFMEIKEEHLNIVGLNKTLTIVQQNIIEAGFHKLRNYFTSADDAKQWSQREVMHERIHSETKRILTNNMQHLDKIHQETDTYHEAVIQQIVLNTIKEMDYLEQDVQKAYSLTAKYRAEMLVVTCSYAVKIFNKMQERNRADHPVTHLQSRKEMYYSNFIQLCMKGVEEKTTAIQIANYAARNLVNLVMSELQSAFKDHLEEAITKMEMQRIWFRSKKDLKYRILLELLEERDFDLFFAYLKNVSKSYFSWIEKFVNDDCDKNPIKGKRMIEKVAEDTVKQLETHITKAITCLPIVTAPNLETWVNIFKQEISHVIPLSNEELHQFVEQQEVQEMTEFKKEVASKFESKLQTFAGEHQDSSIFESVKNEVIQKLCTKLAGCCEQCPFCNEECELSMADHPVQHHCIVHRSQCLRGYRYATNEEMVLETCNANVGSSRLFRCADTNSTCVPFKEYQKYYPNWYIDTEVADVPAYWQWFIGQFSSDIAKAWNMKEPTEMKAKQKLDIWKNISPSAVKKELKKSFGYN